MLFNSFEFLLFFAVVYAAYRILPQRPQNLLLLAASYFFYGFWDPRFLGLLMLSTSIDYFTALRIDAARERGSRLHARRWLWLSIGANLGILGLFKYFGFFAEGFARLLNAVGLEADAPSVSFVLPAGLSFYTFQAMGYTIDVYRKRIPATRSFLDFALFVAFFPQLLAGPIERARSLMPQLQRPRNVSPSQLTEGSWLILWGLFQKVFVADNLLHYTRWGFTAGAAQDSLEVYLLAVASALRVYCDFSGYSDMARGLSKLLGIELSRNFLAPFAATDPAELWRRWHVTLTQWLTDYLYIPLRRKLIDSGLSRRAAVPLATLGTFVLMGLWHGAASKFVVWGAVWGVIIAIQPHVSLRLPPLSTGSHLGRALGLGLRRMLVFHLFAFSLLLIMGPLDVGLQMLKLLLTGFSASSAAAGHALTLLYFGWPVLLAHRAWPGADLERLDWLLGTSARTGLYCGMVLLMLASGATGGEEFIYFRF